MSLEERLVMYKLAYRFIKEDEFRLLHINEEENDIWMEKHVQKTSYLVRLQQGGFDWKNHLKKDITHVFQKAKALEHLLKGKHIRIENIYISEHEPLDEWEMLKKQQLQLKEKNPPKMHIYYINEANQESELRRLEEALETTEITIDRSVDTDKVEGEITAYKRALARLLKAREKKTENVFAYGKPFFTYILIAINIILFGVLELSGGSMNIPTLLRFGANYNPAIAIDGEWWRIISSMFLHIGLLHLVMNMLAIYYIGNVVERIYGSTRMLFIYMLAGIGGGLASFLIPGNVSAGASGAIFGLFGALLFFGVIHRKIFFQTMGTGVLLIIGLNLVLGFSAENIDMAAHLGGLITGFIASAACSLPNQSKPVIQTGAVAVYLILVMVMAMVGMEQTKQEAAPHLYGEWQHGDDQIILDSSSETGWKNTYESGVLNIAFWNARPIVDPVKSSAADQRHIISMMAHRGWPKHNG